MAIEEIKRPARSPWSNPNKKDRVTGIKVWRKLDGFEKCLRLCKDVLEILYEKHWLGKRVQEESRYWPDQLGEL